LGCHSTDKPDYTDTALSNDSITHSNQSDKTDTLTHVSKKYFFDTSMTFKEFEMELVDYVKNNKEKNLSDFDCEDYILRFSVNYRARFGTINHDTTNRLLCDDIEKFKKINETENGYGSWTYDFEAIGNKYYKIRGHMNIGRIEETTYYYQKKE
jgi:hypothetical protein